MSPVKDLQKAFYYMAKPFLAAVEYVLRVIFPERSQAARVFRQPNEFIAIKHGDILIFSLFRYHSPSIRRAIWQLKYKNDRRMTKMLAEFLFEEIMAEVSELMTWNDFGEPILVPIPISIERRKERGYNQTENLARELEHLSRFGLIPDSTLLKKIRHTSPQTTLSRRERQKNLAGCFDAVGAETKSKISGRNIILIDDVLTTGSTIEEASKTLKRLGAKKIIAFTIAYS